MISREEYIALYEELISKRGIEKMKRSIKVTYLPVSALQYVMGTGSDWAEKEWIDTCKREYVKRNTSLGKVLYKR